MSQLLNADEVFSIGVEIEKNGIAFYSAAAQKASQPAARKLFEELAKWEQRHVEIFENLRKGLKVDKGDDVYDPENELGLYLKGAADNHVFVSGMTGAAAAAKCKTPREVLDTALQFEKDSVVYYTAMARMFHGSKGGKGIDKLIDEELKHISMLTQKAKEIA
jgi:rubrerythrin